MDFESSIKSAGITESLSTRWWIDPLDGRDEYGLYVVRYTVAQPGGEFLAAEHLTERGWVRHDLGTNIKPVATVSGFDAVGYAFARKPDARQDTADAIAELLLTPLTAALKTARSEPVL